MKLNGFDYLRDEAAVREGKPEYLSKVAANRSETSSNSNEAFNEMKRHNSLSTSTALLVVIVSVGFMLIALFLLWRRYRFSNRYSFQTPFNLECIGCQDTVHIID